MQAQETKQQNNQIKSNVNSKIGVVDMKKILAQSKAYQSLVDQFEDVRKHRNNFTKQKMLLEMRKVVVKTKKCLV